MAKWTGLTVKIGCNAGGTAVCSTDPPTPTEWVELGDEHNGGADGATCFGVSCSRHSCPMYANGNSDCGAVDGTLYQHRWPSGTVGEGAPEFRIAPSGDDGATDWSSTPQDYGCLRPRDPRGMDEKCDSSRMVECCGASLPYHLGCAIGRGDTPCPSCGHDIRRCRYCRGLLVPQYGGAPRCQDCHNT